MTGLCNGIFALELLLNDLYESRSLQKLKVNWAMKLNLDLASLRGES